MPDCKTITPYPEIGNALVSIFFIFYLGVITNPKAVWYMQYAKQQQTPAAGESRC